jgi:hypothetical protein
LPEVEQELVEHLCQSQNLDTSGNIASLVHRYASRAGIAISTYLDEHVGKLACVSQTPLLAYLLRVDPLAADTPLEKALAARGKGWSACKLPLAGCGQAAE